MKVVAAVVVLVKTFLSNIFFAVYVYFVINKDIIASNTSSYLYVSILNFLFKKIITQK